MPYYRRAEDGISGIKVGSRSFFAVHTTQMKLFLIWPVVLCITSDFRSVLDLWKQELCLGWAYSCEETWFDSELSQSPTYALSVQNDVLYEKCSCMFGGTFFGFSCHFQKASSTDWVKMLSVIQYVPSSSACDWEKLAKCSSVWLWAALVWNSFILIIYIIQKQWYTTVLPSMETIMLAVEFLWM